MKILDSLYTNTGTTLGNTKISLDELEVESSVRERGVLYSRLSNFTETIQERLFLVEEKGMREYGCVALNPGFYYFLSANR